MKFLNVLTIICFVALLISIYGLNSGYSVQEVFSFSFLKPKIENPALVMLKQPSVVKRLNAEKDTIYHNQRLGKVKCYKWGSRNGIGYNFNGTNFHKKLLANLPNGYMSDTSINLRTTNVLANVNYFVESGSWELHYSLWYQNGIIMSSYDEDDPYYFWKLPDMRKYGYK